MRQILLHALLTLVNIEPPGGCLDTFDTHDNTCFMQLHRLALPNAEVGLVPSASFRITAEKVSIRL
jgi:hypothetical protein